MLRFRRQQNHIAPPATQPTLLGLTPELKYMIFDLLLASFLTRNDPQPHYLLPHEEPRNDRTASRSYHSLLSTCKELQADITSYFTKACLPHAVLHFTNDLDLHAFHDAIMRSHTRYHNLRFSIRTRPSLLLPSIQLFKTISDRVYDLIYSQPSLTATHKHTLDNALSTPLTSFANKPGHEVLVSENAYETLRLLPMAGLDITIHRLQGMSDTQYVQMRGNFSALHLSQMEWQAQAQSLMENLGTETVPVAAQAALHELGMLGLMDDLHRFEEFGEKDDNDNDGV